MVYRADTCIIAYLGYFERHPSPLPAPRSCIENLYLLPRHHVSMSGESVVSKRHPIPPTYVSHCAPDGREGRRLDDTVSDTAPGTEVAGVITVARLTTTSFQLTTVLDYRI